jgi:N-acetylmuramoyl-L-alanine amidase
MGNNVGAAKTAFKNYISCYEESYEYTETAFSEVSTATETVSETTAYRTETNSNENYKQEEIETDIPEEKEESMEDTIQVTETIANTEVDIFEESSEPSQTATDIFGDDVKLLALVAMAEAEGESEYGQRLVIDTILNRVDSIYFPDTVYAVVYQPNQFSSMWNGRAERCDIPDEMYQLAQEELDARSDYSVMFFMYGQYSDYGTPMFQVDRHYFSSYE